jgi:hypothetical protein
MLTMAIHCTRLPTFIIFKTGKEVQRIEGANPGALSSAIQKLAAEAGSDGASSSSGGFGDVSGAGSWIGAALPRGYTDVTSEVDIKGLDLLNADSDFGGVRTLFDASQPSAAAAGAGGKGKGKATEDDKGTKDWVESDTDEQLMLYVPFQSTLKVHTIHLTSFAAPASDDDDDDTPLRPRQIQLYTNRAHNLGFEEAEDIPPTQTIELKPEDWDEKTGTARLELRFVKFQNVTSLVIFIVNGEGQSERTRVDRIRIIGETGEKRSMGKLEKIGDEAGE